jgi:hypothetical protein
VVYATTAAVIVMMMLLLMMMVLLMLMMMVLMMVLLMNMPSNPAVAAAHTCRAAGVPSRRCNPASCHPATPQLACSPGGYTPHHPGDFIDSDANVCDWRVHGHVTRQVVRRFDEEQLDSTAIVQV